MSGLPQFPVMAVNRRALFGRAAGGLATAALASLCLLYTSPSPRD